MTTRAQCPSNSSSVDDGIHFIKFWLSVGRDEQAQRLNNKRVGRLDAIQHVLNMLPYQPKHEAVANARQDIVAPVRALLPIIAPDH